MSLPLQNDNGAQKPKSGKSETLEWLITLGIALAVALIIRFFVFEFVMVEGSSMENTLFEPERLFVTKVEYLFGDPERGDIVICHFPESKDYYVKRVIGLPGDAISISGGVLYINSVPQSEDYIKEPMYRDFPETVVPEDHYFVMGDNRNNSKDSRIIGALERSMIKSKVRAVVWPLNRLSWIKQAAPEPVGIQ